MLKLLWARENDLGTMNVPHFVTWGFVPEDPQSAWNQYQYYFNDRYAQRRSVTFACGNQFQSGSHYLTYSLWWLVQDVHCTCSCEMAVWILCD